MATYVNDLRLKEIATGDESGTWGDTTNTNLELIAEAFSYGTEAITTNADTHTTTIADGSTDPGRSMYLKYTGTLDSACTITIGPNTVSKMWFIENATSGSQNIIISQGSGANITIPPGDVKVVYSDGAGSGAAVVDAFASLSVVDLKVQDDLTVTDDVAIGGLATVGGTLGVTGIATFTDDIIIGDGKTIGSASDVDAMTIASNGQVTFTQTLIGTALDISGDIDVDGTTNLDVVDIDGAVDMASTLQVDGAITSSAGATITTADNTNQLTLVSTDADAAVGPVLDLYRNSGSPADDDFLGKINFRGRNDNSQDVNYGYLAYYISDASDGTEDGFMQIGLMKGGSNHLMMEATTTETVFNQGSVDQDFRVESDNLTHALFVQGSDGNVGIGGASPARNLSINATSPTLQLCNSTTGTSASNGFELAVAGDTAYIIQREDANLVIHTNDTERMRISSSGQVSIGTTSTTAPLRVKVATDANFAVQNTSSTVQLQGINDAANAFATIDIAGNPIKFSANGSESMRIDSSGNVGIGRTPISYANSQNTLVIEDSHSPAIAWSDTGQTRDWFAVAQGSGLHFVYADDGGTGGAANVTTSLVLDNSGNVGIGTDSPTDYYSGGDNLVVNTGTGEGGITLASTGSNQWNYILFADGTSGDAAYRGQVAYNHAVDQLYLASSDFLTFATGSSRVERMRIDSGGDVLIGTTSAVRGSEKVSIDGGSADIIAGKTSAAGMVLRKTSFSNGFLLLFERDDNGFAVGSITSNGTSTTYTTSSDYRLKDNIQPMENGLDRVKQLNPVKFKWKQTGVESEGFIAHEVDEIYSECVNGEKDGERMQTMDYGRITPLLVKAIQEQQAQIDALQSEINNLKGE